jgi:ABC-type Na+ transport system ATPase subunit NatA
MTTEVVVAAEGLAKRFGEVHALERIALEVPAGAVLALLGPNGAGKTTTVRILTTLLTPDAGSARTVPGEDPARLAAALAPLVDAILRSKPFGTRFVQHSNGARFLDYHSPPSPSCRCCCIRPRLVARARSS